MAYSDPQLSAQVAVTIVDRSGEKSTTSIYVAEAFDFSDGDADHIPDDLELFLSAIDGISAGVITKVSRQDTAVISAAVTGAGRRESKVLIGYRDNVTLKAYTFTIPCLDGALVTPPLTDFFDITVSPWSGFKTQFEAVGVSPDGNAVTMTYAREVGRNI